MSLDLEQTHALRFSFWEACQSAECQDGSFVDDISNVIYSPK